MSIPRITLTLLLAIWAFTNSASAAHHAAPAPAVDCSSVILNLADCLSFVTAGSTVKKPEGSCCSGLKTVLKTDAECLCEGFKNSAQLGVSLNITKAMALPSACHVSAPSVSNCGMSLGTGAAPALSLVALSPSSVAAAPTTGSAANEVAPVPAPQSAGSLVLTISTASLVLAPVLAYLSLF